MITKRKNLERIIIALATVLIVMPFVVGLFLPHDAVYAAEGDAPKEGLALVPNANKTSTGSTESGFFEPKISFLIAFFVKIYLTILGKILYFVGMLFNVVVRDGSLLINSNVVAAGWVFCRDTVNMLFILVLLVIAFATILKIEAYQYKRLLPALLLSIVLVNFSLTICKIFFEAGDIMIHGLIDAIVGSQGGANVQLSEALAGVVGIGSYLNSSSSSGPLGNMSVSQVTDYSLLTNFIMIAGFISLFFWALLVVTGFFFIRGIAIAFLTVVSPFAFFLQVLPATKSYASKWWSSFIKYWAIGPISAFFIALAYQMGASFNKQSTAMQNAFCGGASFSAPGAEECSINAQLVTTDNGTIFGIMQLLLVCLTLFGAVFAGSALGIQFAGAWQSLVTKGLKGTGLFAGHFLSRSIASNKGIANRMLTALPRAGHALLRGFSGKGFRSTEGFRNKAAAAASFLSPTVAKGAWQGRQQFVDERIFGPAVGRARGLHSSIMNKVPGTLKDKVNWEEIAEGHEEAERMKYYALRNKSGDQTYYAAESLPAWTSKDAPGYAALIKNSGPAKNYNELHRSFFNAYAKGKKGFVEALPKDAQQRVKDYEGTVGAVPYDYMMNQSIMEGIGGKEYAVRLSSDLSDIGLTAGEGTMAVSTRFDEGTGHIDYRRKQWENDAAKEADIKEIISEMKAGGRYEGYAPLNDGGAMARRAAEDIAHKDEHGLGAANEILKGNFQKHGRWTFLDIAHGVTKGHEGEEKIMGISSILRGMADKNAFGDPNISYTNIRGIGPQIMDQMRKPEAVKGMQRELDFRDNKVAKLVAAGKADEAKNEKTLADNFARFVHIVQKGTDIRNVYNESMHSLSDIRSDIHSL